MKKNLILGSLLLCALLAIRASADDKGASAAKDAEMKAWMAAATPGAPHQELSSMAGTWDAEVKDFMNPSGPPVVTKGVSEFSMELGGRFLLQKFHGTMMGQPYEGIGYTGYDNVQKKYVSVYMDNMGTGMMPSTGTEDPATKKVTYIGSMWDATSGAEVKMDQVLTLTDTDHCTFEMFMPTPGGKKTKVMEINYTRRK
jgi:hypothetical protein